MPCLRAAEPEEHTGKVITKIEFVPKDQPVLAAELDEMLPIRPGDTVHLPSIRAAMERLWLTGRYENIVVEAVPAGAGAVTIRFLTEPAWFISKVDVLGVPEPPNPGQLENATRLDLGRRFTEESLRTAATNLHTLLRANGFFEAVITHDLERRPDTEEVDITFHVDPGPRARFTDAVITGNPDRPDQEVIEMTRWRRFWILPGHKHVTQARVQRGLERIRTEYREEDRLMAQVSLERMDYDPANRTATPVIRVIAGPRVEIDTTGVDLSSDTLEELIPVYHEHTVDRDLLMEGARNLVQHLQEKGYFRAQAQFRQETPSPGFQRIVYMVERGPRYKVVNVEVAGNRYFDDETIRERMFIREAGFLFFRRGRFSEEYLRSDIEAITNLYRANGFQEVEVEAIVDENYRGAPREISVVLSIEEGPQWLVADLDVTGVRPENREEVLSRIQSTPGQPFSAFNIATDRENVLNYYYNNGYPDADFVSSTETAAEPNRMKVRYGVRERRQQFVRDVLTGGLKETRPELVHNRIGLEPGDPLSLNTMIQSQHRLYDLGIFAKVDTAVQNRDGLTQNKFVQYQFEEARRYSLQLGLGAQIARIGTSRVDLNRPVAGPGFSPRLQLSLARYNLFGIAHTVRLQGLVSNLQQRALLSYLAPQFQGNENLSLTVSALYDDARDVRTFTSRRREASIQLGQRLSAADSMQYRYTIRRVSVSDVQINPLLIPLVAQPARIGMFSAGYIRDRRVDPIDPARGSLTTIDAGLAARPFASQSDFLRLLIRNATYHQLRKNLIFARQTTLGWINHFGGIDIPLPEKFFAGGAISHRAFAENQAGPRDLETGFPIGGNALLTFQHELRFPLLGTNVGGVLLHDFGNVYSDLASLSFRATQRDITDFDYMVHGVGFGLRLRTPIGPLRADFVWAINPPRFQGFSGSQEQLLFCGTPNPPPDVDCTGVFNVIQRLNGFQFHISLGQAF